VPDRERRALPDVLPTEYRMEQSTSDESRFYLFGGLPPDIFRIFSGETRWLYADLLEYIDSDVFGEVPGIVPRQDMVAAIREFLDRQGRDVRVDDGDDQAEQPPTGVEAKALAAYRRLVDTGWLTEFRDRYRRVVDMNANARLVLTLLFEIKAGRTRSYGGEVLQVLLQLEGADKDPDNRSEAIRNAARSAQSFMHHLRSISSAARHIEEELINQTDMRTLFRKFFDDFVERFLVSDFKRLKSTTNPFRFRRKIIDTAESILGDDQRMTALSQAYIREGRSERLEDASNLIAQELRSVIGVFERIGNYLEMIEATNQRLEQRITNTLRFMDSVMETRTERVIEAIERLGSLPGGLSIELPFPNTPLPDDPVLGREDLYQYRRTKEAAEPRKIQRRPPDPAFLAYRAALDTYRTRTTITAVKMATYLESALRNRREARAADLPLRSLDDFLVFEKLRSLHQLEDGALARRYQIELLAGTFKSEWISCPNFIVRRVREAPSHVGA
jgi:hypothetical protein